MKPTSFKQQNLVLGSDQPQYRPLPAYRADDGMVVSCWSLTILERIKLLFTGKLWLLQLTFNKPLQPQKPQLENPFVE